jgi:hypothetical protein
MVAGQGRHLDILKPIGTVHLFAEDLSATEPAVVLAMFIREGGTTLTTYH